MSKADPAPGPLSREEENDVRRRDLLPRITTSKILLPCSEGEDTRCDFT